MAWDDGLVGTAREIAATDRTPLRVMAGPGTGKSFAMKRRVARLLEGGQDPRRILAVTFTRNAAASLVDDLHDLGVPGSENVRAGTLHAFCFVVLSKEAGRLFVELCLHLDRPFTFARPIGNEMVQAETGHRNIGSRG